nr:class I SAM-dependent methyltransferase [Pseudomonas sp.]
SLVFAQRLENPPEFADINPDSGLKALVFVPVGQAVGSEVAVVADA